MSKTTAALDTPTPPEPRASGCHFGEPERRRLGASFEKACHFDAALPRPSPRIPHRRGTRRTPCHPRARFPPTLASVAPPADLRKGGGGALKTAGLRRRSSHNEAAAAALARNMFNGCAVAALRENEQVKRRRLTFPRL